MLRLKISTDPRWAYLAENNLPELLTDHAFCEQKAASSAISLICTYPEYSELVNTLSEIVIEEMDHFRRVHQIIVERGWALGRERKDDYVNRLFRFFPSTPDRRVNLVYKLLVSAMIEARSCERFRLLYKQFSESDPDLANFYHELEQSEAQHYSVFLNFAKQYGKDLVDVEKKWSEFLDFESKLMEEYGKSELMHG